jgi:hypothetical protein
MVFEGKITISNDAEIVMRYHDLNKITVYAEGTLEDIADGILSDSAVTKVDLSSLIIDFGSFDNFYLTE